MSCSRRASRLQRSKSFTLYSPRPRRRSLSTARASTSRRPAPTKSTPSSTATWRRGASANRAWGRSPSPASPTPWAGAKSAALPTRSPRTWTSKTPVHRDRVQRFWQSPTIATQPGLKAVDMFRAVADGRIKALWIMATNPVVSMPDADHVEAAIRACPFVVVSDVTAATDTIRHAHVRLPAAAWGEKNGTVTNSERRISRQRNFLPLPGEARPDWWIISRSRQADGFCRAPSTTSRRRRFSPSTPRFQASRTAARAISTSAPLRRPMTLSSNGLSHSSGRPRRIPNRHRASSATADISRSTARPASCRFKPPFPSRTSEAFPLTLNTGRVRDHWHTMTRTGKSQRLSQHIAEPYVELHPQDAARHDIADADLVRVSSGLGAVLVRALISPRQQPGVDFRADALDGPVRRSCTHRRAGTVTHRPGIGSAGIKEHRGRASSASCQPRYGFAVAGAKAVRNRSGILGARKMRWWMARRTRFRKQAARLGVLCQVVVWRRRVTPRH